ncbi:MAG: segregation and condensation protein A [Thioalkalispiraceae bacterium]|jgi:hypothetical protein
MSEREMSKEEQILKMVKRVLTDVARDTHVKPGLKHPLTDNTIVGIRECLSLIAARERELLEAAGLSADMRPRFPDQKPKSVVVSIDNLQRSKAESDSNNNND